MVGNILFLIFLGGKFFILVASIATTFRIMTLYGTAFYFAEIKLGVILMNDSVQSSVNLSVILLSIIMLGVIIQTVIA
jgi:hypothetical protein